MANRIVRHRGQLAALALLLLLPTMAQSAPGDFDNSFSGNGRMTHDLTGEDEYTAYGVSTYPSGKIVAAGFGYIGEDIDAVLTRYLEDGTPDEDFGPDGAVTFDLSGYNDADEIVNGALRTGSKIVVVGFIPLSEDEAFILRRLPNGDPDPDFGDNGDFIAEMTGYDEYSAVARQEDGKLVVAGGSCDLACDFLVARFNPDGTLDTDADADPSTHFSNDGWTKTDFGGGGDYAEDLAILPNGKIVLVGRADGDGDDRNFAVAVYKPNGQLDPNFSGNGMKQTDLGITDSAMAVAVLGNSIVAGGSMETSAEPIQRDWAFVAYTFSGKLDSDFAGDGKRVVDLGQMFENVNDMTRQPDGKLLAAGSSGGNPDTKMVVARLTPAGKLDGSFGTNGVRTFGVGTESSIARVVTLDNERRILVAGSSATPDDDVALARLKSGLAP